MPYHTYTNESEEYQDSHVVHTGQMFFEEDLYKQITLLDPYTQDKVERVLNDVDHVYLGDPTATLEVTYADNTLQNGIIGSITVVLDHSATPTPAVEPTVEPQDTDSSAQKTSVFDKVR